MAPSKKSKQAASAKPEGEHGFPFHPLSPHLLTLLAGLERTDNNMNLSSWPQVVAINQKNYYTYELCPQCHHHHHHWYSLPGLY